MIAKLLLKDRHGELKAQHKANKVLDRAERSKQDAEIREELQTNRTAEQALRLANAEQARVLKREMIELRKLEAQSKLKRVETQTLVNNNILTKRRKLETGQGMLLGRIEYLVQLLDTRGDNASNKGVKHV